MRRCTSLTAKPLWRVCIDSSLLFILPALISGFFYVNVIKNLWNQEKRVERNRALSICFIVSWILWVTLWMPKMILGLTQLAQKPINYSAGPLGNRVIAHLVPSQVSIQILYSQLNPFIFIVLIKKIQDFHAELWLLVKQILLLSDERNGEDGKAVKSEIQGNEFGKKCFKKSNDPNFLITIFVMTSVLLTVSTLAASTVSPKVQTVCKSTHELFSNPSNTTKNLRTTITKRNCDVRGLMLF